MKLIIDIDESVYKDLKDYFDTGHYGVKTEFAISNGIPFEKIKAEIEKYINENKNSNDLYLSGCGDGAYHTLVMIEKNLK